jgi:hypothetical protein
MKRRAWLQLAPLLLAGCERSPKDSATVLQAGPFTVAVPPDWATSAIIEKRAIHPVYSAEDWSAFKADASFALKPEYGNRPQHWALRFPAASLRGSEFDAEAAGHDPLAPQILIHKADEWAAAFTDGVHETPSGSEVIDRLRSELEEAKEGAAASRPPGFVDASMDFASLRKQLNFSGGSGVRLICQWGWEPDLIRRGRLHYLFWGLSDDGSCQVTATFPLDHSDLPGDAAEDEHLGRSVSRYEELERGWKAYAEEASAWIAQNAGGFSPGLETLDGILQSLQIRSWE